MKLLLSPFIVIKAADAFHTGTTRPNDIWQTDFTYFKIIGWGWMYLSTVRDEFSRYVIAWGRVPGPGSCASLPRYLNA
jgi:transposase InsO family protein